MVERLAQSMVADPPNRGSAMLRRGTGEGLCVGPRASRRTAFIILALIGLLRPAAAPAAGTAASTGELPANLRAVLDNASPLSFPRAGRLPLFVLPISQSLAGIDDSRSETVLRELDRRGTASKWPPTPPPV
jgi:hypothetical protein